MPESVITKYSQQHLFVWYGEIYYEKTGSDIVNGIC